MRLPLFSSVPRGDTPNLIGIQDEAITNIPTVLVCPLRAGLKLTPVRVEVHRNGKSLIACPELSRPIHRSGLRYLGRLDTDVSRELMERFRALLAH